MKETADGELLKRTAEGDHEAFEAFVDRHAGSVFRYLRHLAAHDQDAEDALQETFLGVWRSAGTFQGRGSARAWLMTVARNALRRQRRLRAGAPERVESLEELAERAGWGIPVCDGTLEHMTRKDLLERALEGLPPEYRELLILRDLEDLSGEEAAEILGLGLPALKSRLHRARLAFAARVRELTDD